MCSFTLYYVLYPRKHVPPPEHFGQGLVWHPEISQNKFLISRALFVERRLCLEFLFECILEHIPCILYCFEAGFALDSCTM